MPVRLDQLDLPAIHLLQRASSMHMSLDARASRRPHDGGAVASRRRRRPRPGGSARQTRRPQRRRGQSPARCSRSLPGAEGGDREKLRDRLGGWQVALPGRAARVAGSAPSAVPRRVISIGRTVMRSARGGARPMPSAAPIATAMTFAHCGARHLVPTTSVDTKGGGVWQAFAISLAARVS